MNSYFGKYRAQVVNVDDPEKRGRIEVLCPRVLGESSSAWCEVCIPVATDNYGDFCLPPVGETVWIEFERGNPDKPIFVGGWYSKEKSPAKDYTQSAQERIISFKNGIILIKEDKVEISTHDKSLVWDLTKDSLTVTKDKSKVVVEGADIIASNGGAKVTIQDSDILASKGNSSVKIQDSSVVISAGGTSCSLTSGALTKLNILLGG